MTYTKEAAAVFNTAKQRLAGLARDALDAHSFEDAATLAAMAGRLETVCAEFGLGGDAHAKAMQAADAEVAHSQAVRAAAEITEFVAARALRPPLGHARRPVSNGGGSGKRREKPRPDSYPRFYRDSDKLVKVGWSSAQGAEYEHRAPKVVVDTLVAAILGEHPDRRFSMEEVLPLKSPESGEDFPSYQPYLALAWLRQTGGVTQNGRDGYTADPAVLQNLGDLWRDLPEERP